MILKELTIIQEFIHQKSDLELIDQKIKKLDSFQVFLELSYAHGVLPIVYQKLSQSKISSTHKDVLQNFKETNNLIAKQNFFMTGQLMHIIHVLESNNIPCIPLKGPMLSFLLYKDINTRQFSDLDILIHPSNIKSTCSLLSSLGFNLVDDIDIELFDFIKDYFYDFTFINKHNNLVVELHWALDKKNTILQHTTLLFESSYPMRFNSSDIDQLQTDIQLLYLCLHGSKHRWERFEWMCDVDRLIRQNEISWNHLLDLAINSNSKNKYLLGLKIVIHYLNTPIRDEKTINLLSSRSLRKLTKIVITLIDNNYFMKSKPSGIRWQELIVTYYLQDTLFDKIKTVFQIFFPFQKKDFYALDNLHSINKWKIFFLRILKKFKL